MCIISVKKVEYVAACHAGVAYREYVIIVSLYISFGSSPPPPQLKISDKALLPSLDKKSVSVTARGHL